MAIRDIALAAAIAASNPSEQGPKKPENPTPIDTRTVLVQEAVQKAMTTDLTAMKLEGLLEEVRKSEKIVLAAGEGVKGLYDFSKLERLGAYKNMTEEEQGKVKKMYDMLVESVKGDKKREEGVKQVILSFVMFVKSVGYNPGTTIGKSEKYLDETVGEVKKYGFGDEFLKGLESSRKVAQERDKYVTELVSLPESELLERINKLEKEIAEMKKANEERTKANEERTKANEERTKANEERLKRIEAKKQILDNLRQVHEAMKKKMG